MCEHLNRRSGRENSRLAYDRHFFVQARCMAWLPSIVRPLIVIDISRSFILFRGGVLFLLTIWWYQDRCARACFS